MDLDLTKHNHFKLYILSEDRFTFESELRRNKIDFYLNLDEQYSPLHSIRYYLRDDDRVLIDKIIVEHEINSGTESIGLNKSVESKSILKLILIIIGLIGFFYLIYSIG